MITKDTIPWRLHDRKPSSEGALSQSQMSHLCSSHILDPKAVGELSRKLDSALSRTLNLSQPELLLSKLDRGSKQLDSVISDLRSAEDRLANTSETLQNLSFKNPYGHIGMPNPSIRHLKALAKCREALSSIRSFVEVAKREQWAVYAGAPDKRRVRDVRRTMVCVAIFNFWEEAGRKLSYTTDPIDRSRRGGPLIDFVNALVECITNPPSQISGDTIKTELEEFKSWGLGD
jgi:hypothetical protein